MAGHGGARPGSGRPANGRNQIYEAIAKGIRAGVARAGQARGLPDGPDLFERSAEMIAYDETLKGNGWDVLRVLVNLAPGKPGDTEPPAGSRSPLIEALSRCPGMTAGTQTALAAPADGQEPGAKPDGAHGTTIPEFLGRLGQGARELSREFFFEPQAALDLDGDGRPDAGGGTPGAPHPPRAAAPGVLHLDGENLEKTGLSHGNRG